MMNEVVEQLLDEFIITVRKQIKDPSNVGIIVDGGWSHPGWWAREHTVIALDDETGLPLGFKHVIKGENYTGSSRGMFVHPLTAQSTRFSDRRISRHRLRSRCRCSH